MFKVGDRIKNIGHLSNRDKLGTITSIFGLTVYVRYDDGSEGNSDKPEQYYQVINITMNTLEKFALAFKSEPEKSFRKAGITNGDDLLTEDGQKIFLSWLLKKQGAEFKTEVVDDLLKEEEK